MGRRHAQVMIVHTFALFTISEGVEGRAPSLVGAAGGWGFGPISQSLRSACSLTSILPYPVDGTPAVHHTWSRLQIRKDGPAVEYGTTHE